LAIPAILAMLAISFTADLREWSRIKESARRSNEDTA
jgi:hypothetical protein